jgi:tetratricopeptide (TPR) repeat protein
MNPILREYLLKGIFLGLWAYLAVLQPPAAPDWPRFNRVLAATGIGLGLGLLIGAVMQIRRGFTPGANPLGFLLTVLMESPLWIYLGIVGGLAVGLVTQYDPVPEKNWLAYFVVGGVVLGYGFYQLRQVKEWVWRFGIAAAIGAALVYLALHYVGFILPPDDPFARQNFGWYVLIGLPFFYLLTFCGEAEESEVEIAALCAGLGVGLDMIGLSSGTGLLGGKLVLLFPVIVYFLYATRILPGMRVFKHALRGYSALHLGRHVEAVVAFKRALRLNPADKLATEGLWALHQRVDVTRLPPDSDLLRFLDYDFCLDKAAAYLFGDRPPTVEEQAKANAMLDLVERQRPALAARVDYLRAVGRTHAKQFDAAADTLARLLDPGAPYDPAVRNAVLFPAWDLALRLHPELVRRLGPAELDKPGRRMGAIGVTERRLAEAPTDPVANELKTVLYAGLSEAEFAADAASGPPADFNYDYVEQLGLALADAPDPAERDRGMAYLRIAGRGLPHRGPGIFARLADLAAKNGHADEVRGYLEQVKRSGLAAGPKNLPDDQRAVYYDALKKLADDAEARGEYEAAVGDLRLYLEGGKNELESFRKMADLYEKTGDPKNVLNALLMTETALVYSGKDRDLLARKDKYYYSVDPDRLAAVREKVEPFFDVDYCVKKARQVLEGKDADVELLDWAIHLTRLAKVMRPEGNAVRYAEARGLLRKGEKDAALKVLEDLREAKKGSGDEEDAWYAATKTLAELYFNDYDRPDLAVRCYLDYREYSKSGADTLFQIARCYEAMGDKKNAIAFYETVTAYDQHPRYWDATEAVRRLKEAV